MNSVKPRIIITLFNVRFRCFYFCLTLQRFLISTTTIRTPFRSGITLLLRIFQDTFCNEQCCSTSRTYCWFGVDAINVIVRGERVTKHDHGSMDITQTKGKNVMTSRRRRVISVFFLRVDIIFVTAFDQRQTWWEQRRYRRQSILWKKRTQCKPAILLFRDHERW